jgi:hypothetical protein
MAGICYYPSENRLMKKNWLRISLFAAGLLLGNLLPRHWMTTPAGAAPADVKGSPNVAVDTFRNRDDTFILWSDGSISRASGGPKVNGPTEYTNPPTGSNVAAPVMANGRVLGSPNVAVKAIPRGDLTLVLFSDGSLKKPTNIAAGAESSVPGQLYMGSVRRWTNGQALTNGVWDDNSEYTIEAFDVSTGSAKFRVTMKKDIKGATKSTANYNVYSRTMGGFTSVVLTGATSDGGKTYIYDIGAQYLGYNNDQNYPNAFSFSTQGE